MYNDDSKIPEDVIINLILVENDVRPSMLVQPADYNEATGSDKKTKLILKNIREQFPNLIQSENYKGNYQGILISKKSYDDENINLNDMGRILGYPCYSDYGNIDHNETSYSVMLKVVFNDGHSVYFYANKCKKNSKEEFENIANEASKVLKSHKVYGPLVEEVVLEVVVDVPTIVVLDKVIQNIELNKNENDQILTVLYNLSFGLETQLFFIEHFHAENEYHKGLLIALLTYFINTPIEPFIPLQNFKEEVKVHTTLVRDLEVEIIHILDPSTSIQNIPLDADEIQQTLKNIGFSADLQSNLRGKNKIEKGIILFLIAFGKHNELQPFQKLSGEHPEKVNEMNGLITKWGDDILSITKKINGGKKSNTRRKKSSKRSSNRKSRKNKMNGKRTKKQCR